MKNILLTNFMFLFLFLSCVSESAEDLVDISETDEDITVTYDANIADLMASRCLNCHDDPTANGAPFSLNTFDLVLARNEVILDAIQGVNGTSIMPPSGGLSATEVALFQEWINDGLLEN